MRIAMAKLSPFAGPRHRKRSTRHLPGAGSKKSPAGSDIDNRSDYATTVSLISKSLHVPESGERFQLVPVDLPTSDNSNILIVHPSDFQSGDLVLVNDRFPMGIQRDNTRKLARGQVGISAVQGKLMNVSTTEDTVTVLPLNPTLQEFNLSLVFLDLEINFLQHEIPCSYSSAEMAEHFAQTFKGRNLGRDQQLVFKYGIQYFKVTVKDIVMPTLQEQARTSQATLVSPAAEMGTVTENTKISFTTVPNSLLIIEQNRLLPNSSPTPALDRPGTSLTWGGSPRRRGFTINIALPKKRETEVSPPGQLRETGRTKSLPSPTGKTPANKAAGSVGHNQERSDATTKGGFLDDIPIHTGMLDLTALMKLPESDTGDLTAVAKKFDLAVPHGIEFPAKDNEVPVTAENTAGDLIMPVEILTTHTKGTKQDELADGRENLGIKRATKTLTTVETTERTVKRRHFTDPKTFAATGRPVEGVLKETTEVTNRNAIIERVKDGKVKETKVTDSISTTTKIERTLEGGTALNGNSVVTETPVDVEKPKHQLHPILKLISNPESLGIGGLDKGFRTLFKYALASRLYPQKLASCLGMQHVKGIIFHGPPGTGKSLLARKMADCLEAKVHIVSGPEILDKFIGGSEMNLRGLFAEAEKDYKEHPLDSGLHVIIFDEIDAIGKRRGGNAGATGRVGDSIVNQLLSKMDGVNSLPNVLIVGTTNRLEMIDEALLRPGRFEVPFKFGMPDAKGRRQILDAHISELGGNSRLHEDVDLPQLAELTSSFSGADIAGLVRSARNIALDRQYPLETHFNAENFDKLFVTMNDFQVALDQIRPTHHPSLEDLRRVASYGLITFDQPANTVQTLLRKGMLCVKQVRTAGETRPISILIHGLPETGKTALAVTIAENSQFPCIRLVSPDSVVGFSEHQQVGSINKTFSDCNKNQFSVVILDDVEQLLDWDPIRESYSMKVLRALSILFKRSLPKDHGLLIIATSSNRSVLTKLQLLKLFDTQLLVPPLSTSSAMRTVLRSVELFSTEAELDLAMANIHMRVSYEQDRAKIPAIGVKRLLRIIAMAKQEQNSGDAVERLVEELLDNVADSEVRVRTKQLDFMDIAKLD